MLKPLITALSLASLLALTGCQETAKQQSVEKDFDESTFIDSNLPIMVIDTNGNIPDEPKVLARMKLINEGTTNRLDNMINLDYGEDEDNRYIGIEVRGFGSQKFAKQQYGIELWEADNDKSLANYDLGTTENQLESDEAIDDNSKELLDMPKEEDWVLYAPYSDKTLMRNVVAYELANNISNYWHPRTKFVEVFFQSDSELDYRGVYVLTEKIKRDKNRVNINKLKEEEISGEDLTGGYLLELTPKNRLWRDPDKAKISVSNTSPERHLFVEYPKGDDMQPEQKDYISNVFSDFISLIYADQAPTISQLEAHVDTDSLINYLLINELFKNRDAFYSSTYFHKEKNEKIVIGPVWDFNLSSGNDTHVKNINTSPSGWFYRNTWLAEKIFENPELKQALKNRWQALRENEFSDETLSAIISKYYDQLNQGAAKRNFEKWDILGKYIQGNQIPDSNSHKEEVDHFKNWILKRAAWIDSNISKL